MGDTADFLSGTAWLELPGRQTYVLKGDCHIGRTAGNEIINPDTRISRRNSVVQREGSHFVLVDLASTNGTMLNGQRIFKPTRLKDRDVITVGAENYVFRQPPASDGMETDSGNSLLNRTMVAVGKSGCWMLRASAGVAGDLISELTKSGAGVKRMPDGVLFAHWREGRVDAGTVRSAILEMAKRPRGAGGVITVHHGTARVGPGPNPGEENVLGPDVTFTHQLAALSASTGANFVVSAAAVRALKLEDAARPLGELAVPGVAGTHAVFGL
jgi:hypothetical protein